MENIKKKQKKTGCSISQENVFKPALEASVQTVASSVPFRVSQYL